MDSENPFLYSLSLSTAQRRGVEYGRAAFFGLRCPTHTSSDFRYVRVRLGMEPRTQLSFHWCRWLFGSGMGFAFFHFFLSFFSFLFFLSFHSVLFLKRVCLPNRVSLNSRAEMVGSGCANFRWIVGLKSLTVWFGLVWFTDGRKKERKKKERVRFSILG